MFNFWFSFHLGWGWYLQIAFVASKFMLSQRDAFLEQPPVPDIWWRRSSKEQTQMWPSLPPSAPTFVRVLPWYHASGQQMLWWKTLYWRNQGQGGLWTCVHSHVHVSPRGLITPYIIQRMKYFHMKPFTRKPWRPMTIIQWVCICAFPSLHQTSSLTRIPSG